MPQRSFRKCETCEWSDDGCHNINVLLTLATDTFILNTIDGVVKPEPPFKVLNWCSEWKSSKPETCGMCEWFFPFGGGQIGGCNHSTVQPQKYSSCAGACEHFRRKDAD